jgi:hypothetical protein
MAQMQKAFSESPSGEHRLHFLMNSIVSRPSIGVEFSIKNHYSELAAVGYSVLGFA